MSAPIATVVPLATFPLATFPLATDIPPDVDIADVVRDVSDDGVSAPTGDVAELAQVVERAGEHDIRLSVVVLDEDPGRDSQLRDLATEVGAQEGGTVLVLSPSWVGTYSDSFSRVRLESGQDHTYTGDAVVSANNFVDDLVEPGVQWALITAVLIVLVVAAAAVSLVAKTRRRSAASAGADKIHSGGDRSETAASKAE